MLRRRNKPSMINHFTQLMLTSDSMMNRGTRMKNLMSMQVNLYQEEIKGILMNFMIKSRHLNKNQRIMKKIFLNWTKMKKIFMIRISDTNETNFEVEFRLILHFLLIKNCFFLIFSLLFVGNQNWMLINWFQIFLESSLSLTG